MKLNVLLITYNQETYIRKALDSILVQEANFEFDIIVADDSSTDSTLDIIEEYAKQSNIQFHFLPKEANLGFVKNYQRAFSICDAEYVSVMEGDDYWVGRNHLQNHVDFLDKYPECSMSFNRHIRLFEKKDGTSREEIFNWESEQSYELISTEELIYGNRIGNLSCCVFRNKLIQKLEPKIFDLNFADWLLGMIMGQYGSLARQKEVTSAYRIHEDGQWSRMTNKEQDKQILDFIDGYDEALNYKYTKAFNQLKKWKTINVYGDKSLKGRIKRLTPNCCIKLYRKIFR